MEYNQELIPSTVLHWNYRGYTEFPIQCLQDDESKITDIYLKENLISRIPSDIGKLAHLESLYLSGNDITELPREISQLRCLKCLDVSGNRLRHIPEEIVDVGGLKFLILDENELRDLPLRLVELRSLRYLSVCDNKLQWLPQRPVHNYHHCEFRFWRNPTLKSIPYSLWYHMFRGQQTRSLNIGCLNIPNYQHQSNCNRCRLKINIESREYEFDIGCPTQHSTILEYGMTSPPGLFEICKRVLYQMISDTAKKLRTEIGSFHSGDIQQNHTENTAENNFEEFHDNGNLNFNCDVNGNSLTLPAQNPLSNICNKKTRKKCLVPADITEKYFSFLPIYIKEDLSNGPVSRCENIRCKRPVFDYVQYEFCLGKIILIDNSEDVILSAALCSKTCANVWRRGKSNILQWTVV